MDPNVTLSEKELADKLFAMWQFRAENEAEVDSLMLDRPDYAAEVSTQSIAAECSPEVKQTLTEKVATIYTVASERDDIINSMGFYEKLDSWLETTYGS